MQIATYFVVLIKLIILNAQSTPPWYEDLPAVAMDYKVHIDPLKEGKKFVAYAAYCAE